MARYALVIGIAEYTNSFKSLDSPVQNANAIAEILDQYGDFNQVKRLPFRREAGQKDLGKVIRKPLPNETLVRELQQFLQDANGSDVLIYYSGHGFTKLDPLSLSPEGFLAPSDCQIELNAAGQVIAEKSGISLFSLNALINRHTFNSLVVILDCCNSGAFLESSMVRRDVTAFGYQRDYYLITACRSSSKAYEGEEYSLLTAALLKGLSPANASPGSRRISGDRLFDVIGNELQNSRQEPIRMGWGRMITLVRYLQQPESSELVVHAFNATNPYMGLKPFEREQADYFFGREQVVRALLDRLAENRFLAVIGPSGCGKSSLVKAGLLPELENDRIPGSCNWQIEIITPGQYPLQALNNALEQHHSGDKSVVLFVDQFEELFTLCPNEEEQRAFIKQLNKETNDLAKQTRIIIAMRGDFLDRCAKFQEAADLINSTAPTTYMVIPLTEAKLVAELEDSITCPALLHGVSFETGLVSRIVDDVINQLGAMPLLQYALAQLWEYCISPQSVSHCLTISGYEAIEGVKGALQRWADQFYTNLSSEDQTFVRDLVSELVQIGDSGEVTRRRAPWERLRAISSSQAQLDRIIGRLVYQRLLVADDKTVEVAHEALLSESKLIQGWIEENWESIRLQQRLEIYCREWQEHDRSENYLLEAGRLAAIEAWIEKKHPRLMNIDQAFIEQSRERRDRQFQTQLEQERKLREAAEQRELAEIEKKLEAEARAEAEAEKVKESIARFKAEKRGKQVAIVAGILAVSTLTMSYLIKSTLDAETQKTILEIENLVNQSEKLLETHYELEALETSAEALNKLSSIQSKDEIKLKRLQEVILKTRERNRLEDHGAQVTGVSFSPTEDIIATASADKKIRLWDNQGRFIHDFVAHKKPIWILRYSPNGQFLASTSIDKTLKIWGNKGSLIHTFEEHKNSVYGVSFSSDSARIASSDKDGLIIVHNLKNYQVINTLNVAKDLREKTPFVHGVDFNPKNINQIAYSGSFDGGSIKIWNLKENQSVTLASKKSAYIRTVKFSPNANLLAAASYDGIIWLWEIKDQQFVLTSEINAEQGQISDIQFSLDSKTLASAGDDSTVKLWSIVNNKLSQKSSLILQGPHSPTNRLDFNPRNQNILASGSDDKTVRLWDIKSDLNKNSNNQFDLPKLLTLNCTYLKSYLETNSKSHKDKICE